MKWHLSMTMISTALMPAAWQDLARAAAPSEAEAVAAIEDILGLGRMSKFDYFSRSLADVFSATPDFAPYRSLVPQTDMKETNPSKGVAARMSEGLDLRAADRSDDALFNRVLWYMLKPDSAAPPIENKAPLHTLQAAR